jgi:hypothetical protein
MSSHDLLTSTIRSPACESIVTFTIRKRKCKVNIKPAEGRDKAPDNALGTNIPASRSARRRRKGFPPKELTGIDSVGHQRSSHPKCLNCGEEAQAIQEEDAESSGNGALRDLKSQNHCQTFQIMVEWLDAKSQHDQFNPRVIADNEIVAASTTRIRCGEAYIVR